MSKNIIFLQRFVGFIAEFTNIFELFSDVLLHCYIKCVNGRRVNA